MGKDLKSFLIKEAILTSFIIIVGFVVFSTFLKDHYLPVYFIILAFISILTAVFHRGILKTKEDKSSKFIYSFMINSGIKMISYLVFIVSYVFIFKEKALNFLIIFLILYVIYTIFDVYLIYQSFKK